MDDARILATINSHRRRHVVGDLRWDSSCANQAQRWANRGIYTHSNTEGFGESLYISTDPRDADATTACISAINKWQDEERVYNYSSPTFSKATGHFTQNVWRGTTHVGFGFGTANHQGRSWHYVVASFSPPGNVLGRFARNVFAPGSAPAPPASATQTTPSGFSFSTASATNSTTTSTLTRFQTKGMPVAFRSYHGTYLTATASDQVTLSSRKNGDASKWLLEDASDGRYFIRNLAYGVYLRGGMTSPTTVDLIGCKREWERWGFVKTTLNGSQAYFFKLYEFGFNPRWSGQPDNLRGDPNGAVLLTTNDYEREKWAVVSS